MVSRGSHSSHPPGPTVTRHVDAAIGTGGAIDLLGGLGIEQGGGVPDNLGSQLEDVAADQSTGRGNECGGLDFVTRRGGKQYPHRITLVEILQSGGAGLIDAIDHPPDAVNRDRRWRLRLGIAFRQ